MLVLVLLTAVVLYLVGLRMILASEAYEVGRRVAGLELGLQENEATRLVELAWWRPWSYGESALSGNAAFTVCGLMNSGSKKCFEMSVSKRNLKWEVVSVKER